jgi:hypothetical protein
MWRLLLVLAIMSFVCGCGMALHDALREHGSVMGLDRAVERRAEAERDVQVQATSLPARPAGLSAVHPEARPATHPGPRD